MESKEETIQVLFSGTNKYTIPAYQRLYSWDEDDCQKLWDDLVDYALGIWNDEADDFLESCEKYFLGPVVLYQPDPKKNSFEIIDGQQRFTTLLLMLRAAKTYLDKHSSTDGRHFTVQDEINAVFERDEKQIQRLESNIALDADKKDFDDILAYGQPQNIVPKPKKPSRYVRNYNFFIDQFENHQVDFTTTIPLAKFLDCILHYCEVLKITETGSFDSALTIFSSLNDRGKPLSDSDIFKSEIYETFRNANRDNEFLDRWKNIEDLASGTFNLSNGVIKDKIGYMNKLFEHLMYYKIAQNQVKDNNMMKLRKFFENQKLNRDNTSNERYQLLHNCDVLKELEDIAMFWSSIKNHDLSIFPENSNSNEIGNTILKHMSILSFSPNELSSYIITVYFMKHHQRDEGEKYKFNIYIDDPDKFNSFLKNLIGYVWMSTLVATRGKTIKSEVINKMISIVDGLYTPFSNNNDISEEQIEDALKENCFANSYKMTYPMIAWWAYYRDFNQQDLLPNEIKFNVEHIYNVARQNNLGELEEGLLDSIGNKALLEEKINKGAKGLPFDEKVAWYKGTAKNSHAKTNVIELLTIDEGGKKKSFNESDIKERRDNISFAFIEFLKSLHFL